MSRFRASAVLVAAFVAAGLSAGVANAAGPVQLKSRLGDWCLDGPGSNAAAVLNRCAGSQTQMWDVDAGGQIRSVAFPQQCLSISTGADTTPATLAPCQVNASNQRWNSQGDGQLVSLGACLNVNGGVAQPGTAVIAYRCLADVTDEQWDTV
ncbi:hypothetical protein M2272_004789 [Mycobacterium frederiksbergense]|uniref:Ricin B lectin domain-containing protein n=1 Tax=Mycolicibacterium frederiksbergense TaxID=117567 RepID=A0ABT6L707_9MYCO|nr:RICIN domain-containing protein [Mycolicibacterium frederiksbergense]MDH6198130.1 hypothetical protein [Mycolicibacterium frederiksbergense]